MGIPFIASWSFVIENPKIKWMITRGSSMTYGALKCVKPKKQIWQDIERYKPTIKTHIVQVVQYARI